MSRILYAWELGGNLGHIGPFAPLADALAGRGHEVLVAARETVACARVFGHGGRWLQAPLVAEDGSRGSPVSYADLLLLNGYADPDTLLGLVVAWRQLIQLARPNLLLADHAPTAILAARTLGVPVMLFGSGFQCPPRCDPFPGMRPWQPLAEAPLADVARRALACINRVLGQLGCTPLTVLSDIFQVAEDALLTLPELDHYPQRGAARYWGLIAASQPARTLTWPPGNGKRVFAYLRDGHPHVRGALDALARSGASVIAFLPDRALDEQAPLPANVAVSREPLDIAPLAREADAAVLNGGMASTAAFLLAGKPVLCLPMHLEQYLTAWRIAELGAGLLVSPLDAAPGMHAVLARLLDDPGLRSAAAGFAAKYADLDQSTVLANLVGRIENLCATAPMATRSDSR